MKQFGKIMLFALGFGLLAAALSFIPSRPAAASGSAPVMVVNTPLPVDVNSLPAVQAQQSGAWNVGITGTPNVAVTNPLDNSSKPIPLAVAPQAPQPYRSTCASTTNSNLTSCDFQTIPVGMRLVIQEFDFFGDASPGEAIVDVSLSTTVNNILDSHHFALTTNATTVFGSALAAHQPTTLFADANTTPRCLQAQTAVPPAQNVCAISGYLVPAVQ